MPTLKYMVRGSLRKDNTYSCVIRITHRRKSSFIFTGIYVSANEVTKSGKIKSKLAVAKLEDIMIEYRNKLLVMDDIEDLDVKDIANILLYREDKFRLDFFEFSKERISRMKSGTQRSYLATLKHLRVVTGSKLPIENFTRSVVDAMCANLKDSGMVRAPSLYMQCLKNLFKMACDQYNGEHMDSWKIKHNPFYNFKMPKERLVPSRALTLDQVREIITMPYVSAGECEAPGIVNFGRDMFVLSLCLLGINSADMYECSDIKDDIITYYRQKTKDKRDDGALMKVNIHPLIKKVAEKYISGNSFVFKDKYVTAHNFNQTINKGLKILRPLLNKILKEKGIPEIEDTLTYYFARHTMATVAQNEVGINKYMIGELLNHSLEGALKTTNKYTKKDWGRIFEANNKIVYFILQGNEYDPEETKQLSGRSNTGYKGVYFYKGRYRAVYFFNGTNRNVGFFPTLEEAVEARNEYIKKASK